jgi:hypothetical protein
LKGSGAPFSHNDRGCIAAGAVSRESIVEIAPPGVRTTMKPPPPIPQENGSVTPSTAAAVTAASTALPPSRRASTAAEVATPSTVAAAPPEPVATGCGTCWKGSAETAAGAARAAATARVQSRRRTTLSHLYP